MFQNIDERVIEERKRELAAANIGITAQPIIIVVAHTLQEVESVYVRIESLLYQVSSVLQALDLLFKTHQTLHVSYPLPCEAVWLAIQRGFYGLKLAGDPRIIAVMNFLAQLGLH